MRQRLPSALCVRGARARALTHSVGEELEVAAVREGAEADEEDLLRDMAGVRPHGWDVWEAVWRGAVPARR
jgi:hypothetical protein